MKLWLLNATPINHQIKLFIYQCVVENKLDAIVASLPAFSISDALMENIEGYVIAVLLSAKLSAYKGTIPWDHVITIIMLHHINIPENLDKDQHAANTIKSAVQNSLTQARSKIKKAIKKSKTLGESVNIFDLATGIVGNTQCSVTRKVHTEDTGNKFWDVVNGRLKLLRSSSGGDTKKMTKALSGILTADCTLYGIGTTYTIGDNPTLWQHSIDNVIEGV
ncbi:uncharacterized protein LACBIDRAFT_331664 [Laccaria bicolor S238N-H82]|uniref:Predicted protein n=1 Tax=Laccaria bicolor (strain S238N-H82 / ATCC MYA-4686) TaxID=486041 RepID=B0DQ61_LACBS|nr:uncharacterized protein LACBIDRAFT_331664 [Laccaria bicolor S238N-H82]EDR03236.1 predicted protein [Laccaria bicolor S238N-H82]|eukprot:XP_001886032.1 predicted protein [Laccaria bicolor S238N-H82]